jgi:hypothetical protein
MWVSILSNGMVVSRDFAHEVFRVVMLFSIGKYTAGGVEGRREVECSCGNPEAMARELLL